MNHFEPAAIPAAKFSIGQLVRVSRPPRAKQIRDPKADGVFEGRIAGMLFTGKDAALASRTTTGWTYTIEIPVSAILNSSYLEVHEIAWEEEIEIADIPLVDIPFAVLHQVPMPKFHLFQQVKANGGKQGIVVGMEYISLFTAIVNSFTAYGWEYDVDFCFGMPVEKALGYLNSSTESSGRFDECDLESVEA